MGPTVPSTSMMPVQPRTDAAIMVDGSAAHRAGWSAGADDPRRMAGKRLQLVLFHRQADQLAGGPQLEVKGPLSGFTDRAGRDPGHLLEVEAGRGHPVILPHRFRPLKRRSGPLGKRPAKGGGGWVDPSR